MTAFEVERFRHTVGVTSARATFVAGFAYYEIGRHEFARQFDVAYVTLLTGTFVFAVVSAAASSFSSYFLNRLHTPSAALAFVRSAIMLARLSWITFCLSLLTWLVALSRIGIVYYPDSSKRWTVLGVMLAALCLVVAVVFIVGRRVAAAARLPADTPAPRKPFDTGVPISEYLLQQCNTSGNNATLLAGFAVVTVVRYQAAASNAGTTYLAAGCIATVLSIFASATLTVVDVFLFDTPPGGVREALAISLLPVWRTLSLSTLFSNLVLLLAVSLSGYGADFQRNADLPLLYGCVGLVAFIAQYLCYSRPYYLLSLQRDAPEASPPAPAPPAATAAKVDSRVGTQPAGAASDDKGDDQGADVDRAAYDTVKDRMLAVRGQAVVFASFTLYNIVTFSTDVRGLDTPAVWQRFFLGASCIAFVMGLLAYAGATLFVTYSAAVKPHQLNAYAANTRAGQRLTFGTFVLGLLTFMNSFGALGVAKFNPASLAPAIGIGVGYVFLIVGTLTLAVLAVQAKRTPRRASPPSSPDSDPAVLKRRLSSFASASMFQGGFSFFAVLFLTTPQRTGSRVYLIAAAVSFLIALLQQTWSVIVTLLLSWLPDARTRSVFAYSLRHHPATAGVGYYLGVVAFGLAFALVGLVKNVPDYATFSPVVGIGGGAGLLVTLVACAHVERLAAGAATAVRTLDVSGVNVDRVLSRVAVVSGNAAFTSGNVFFEVLFTDLAPKGKPWPWTYLATTTLTFALGVYVVVVTTVFTSRVDRIQSPLRRKQLCLMARPVMRTASVAYIASFFVWLASTVVFGYNKYSTEARAMPAVWSALGLAALLALLVFAHRKFTPLAVSTDVTPAQMVAASAGGGPPIDLLDIRRDSKTVVNPLLLQGDALGRPGALHEL